MSASFCWMCGKPLRMGRDGNLIAKPHEIEPGNIVLVHVVCERNAKEPEPARANRGVKKAVKNYIDFGVQFWEKK